MPAEDLPLFRAHPALREFVARQPFIDGPTPVEPLRLPGCEDANLYVKRDERSCSLYGGNKPRKLEFIIGRALERGSRRLVTTGGLGTHHGFATTILGRSVGLATTLVLVPQPITPEVEQSLALDAAYGAEIVRTSGVPAAVLATLRVLAASQWRGEKPHLVWTGGSSSVGNLGFVSAAFELAEQIEQGLLPKPAEILVPIGSGGTIAGLVVGLKLAGLDTCVRGVLVSDILPPSPRALARSARATLNRMRRLAPDIPVVDLHASDFPIDTSELGPGYGVATASGAAAQACARELGLELDATYSAKCFAALIARARSASLPRGPVLFWSTYAGALCPDFESLPGYEAAT
ncbi:MAG: pyridoxal-phosphate dependent enzyme [Deltaproteobacteria bacterium]|nr:pyridoxal-phosphate dependent enzyme [Deltaproteobacteria bacterium]